MSQTYTGWNDQGRGQVSWQVSQQGSDQVYEQASKLQCWHMASVARTSGLPGRGC